MLEDGGSQVRIDDKRSRGKVTKTALTYCTTPPGQVSFEVFIHQREDIDYFYTRHIRLQPYFRYSLSTSGKVTDAVVNRDKPTSTKEFEKVEWLSNQLDSH